VIPTDRRARIGVLALCASLSFVAPLHAQAPAAPAPAPPPPPPREGTAEFSFVGTTGNSSTSALGLSGEYIRRSDPWELRARAGYVRNHSEGELKAEAIKAGFRAQRRLTERVSTFGDYSYLHDRFAGIESRHTIGGGLTYSLVRPEPHQLDLDAGIGYTHENQVETDSKSTAEALFGARYKYRLSTTADVTNDLTFNLSLSQSDDWRTGNTASLTVKIASIFSLKLTNSIRYVNAPVVGFETTDTITSIALVAKF
jgi:putative salt-induced outer membrane protein